MTNLNRLSEMTRAALQAAHPLADRSEALGWFAKFTNVDILEAVLRKYPGPDSETLRVLMTNAWKITSKVRICLLWTLMRLLGSTDRA